jgi:hypothetical protein
VLATNVSDGLARLNSFQDGDDLRLAEFALSHSASWRHTRPETSTFQWPGFKGGLQVGLGKHSPQQLLSWHLLSCKPVAQAHQTFRSQQVVET